MAIDLKNLYLEKRLIAPHPLTKFEIQIYYKNEPRFMGLILEIKKVINNKNIIANIFRIQGYDSVMSEYFCIGFIDYILKDNSLTDFTNLIPPNNLKKR